MPKPPAPSPKEAKLLAELEALRVREEAVAQAVRARKEAEAKRLAIPEDFIRLGDGCAYIGFAQFNTPVIAQKGKAAKHSFDLIYQNKLNENPLNIWIRSIAYLDQHGWLKIWHAGSGEVCEVPPTNIASIRRLEPKLIEAMKAQHPTHFGGK